MLKSYLKLAIRQLQKQKFLAAINVFGLSAGIACFALLLLFISNEWGFDRFNTKAKQIYRLYIVWADPSTGKPANVYTEYYNTTHQQAGPAIKQFFPEVEEYVRLKLPWGESLLQAEGKRIQVQVAFADASLFSVFDFPLVAGSKAGVLKRLNDVVITEARAKQLFGSPEKAIGALIDIELGMKLFPFTVSGVASDPPANSTVRFDVVGSWLFADAHSPDEFVIGNNWHPDVNETFVQLRPGTAVATDRKRLQRFTLSFTPPATWPEMGFTNWKRKDPPIQLNLQPLLSIHTDANFHAWQIEDYQRIDPQILWILLAIAIGVLLIACINFTTLAIARSASRGKEVGIRKVIGARRTQIVFQYLSEAMLLSAVSAFAGFLLATILLPLLNKLSGRSLSFSLIEYPLFFVALLATVLLSGLLAGSYPAFVLSRFRPIDVLKGKIRLGGGNWFTRSLVSFQFAVSITLIGCTIIILQQTKFMLARNPGFEKENVVAIDASQTDPAISVPALARALMNQPDITGITSAAAGMGAGKGLLSYSDKFKADINVIDTNYIRVMGMQLLAGNNLTPAPMGDSQRPVVINETLMRAMGWTLSNAVGQRINPFQGGIAVVAGVVKNFNYQPVGQPVFNQIFTCTGERGYINCYVRLRAGDPAKALQLIRDTWQTVAPGVPLKYSFLDEDLDAFYHNEQTLSGMVASAGTISILLACLGLLGLASLSAVNRRKEVGIRKVLGASVRELVFLLSGDFLRLVLVAFLVAAPLTWCIMHQWLQNYLVRIELHFSVLLIAGIAAIVTAILAVGLQAIRAAGANPVSSLRSE